MKTRIPPPVITLLAAILMWVLHRWMPLAQLIVSPWNRLGWLFAGAGIGIAAAALKRFKLARTTVNPREPHTASSLVTGGVFQIGRNPMYLGLLLILVGWALGLGTASPWIVPPVFVIVITVLQIIPEEQVLEKLFGTPYVEYRQRVARWIGRRASANKNDRNPEKTHV